MTQNFYKRMMDFILKNFRGQQKRRLIVYLNSELFEEELNKLMSDQQNAGENITKEFAAECLLESQADRENDEYKTIRI